jgi:hypothetical protein
MIEEQRFDFNEIAAPLEIAREWANHPPAQQHSPTSTSAAKSIAEHAPKMRDRVYREICKWPGTDQELAHRLEMDENSVRPRRVELVKEGRIRKVNQRRTRAGRLAAVWGGMTDADRIAKWLLRKHPENAGGSGGAWASIFAANIAADSENFVMEALGFNDPTHEWCGYGEDL